MPIIKYQKGENGVQWAVWHVVEDIHTLLKSAKNPAERAQEVSAIQSPKRQLEYIVPRLILEFLLEEEVMVDYTVHGKPFLRNSRFEISLSHTNGYAAAVVSPVSKVGIDIEKIATRVLNIQSRFLSAEELGFVDKGLEVEHLLLLWSAKESVYKAMEEEGVDFKEELHTAPFTPLSKGVIRIQELRTQAQRFFELEYYVTEEYVLTVTL